MQAKDGLKELTDEVLQKRYAKLMGVIERLVADVNCFVPKDLADARENFEAEIAHRRGGVGSER